MKKNGFTLAEVLITMGIIGVIAAVTLPALNGNMLERTAITKYKRAYMTLNNVGQMLTANEKFSYSNLTDDKTTGNASNGSLQPNLYAALDKYAKIDKAATAKLNKDSSSVFKGGNCGSYTTGQIVFNDGTLFCYSTINGGFIRGIIDVNGVAGPNKPGVCDDDKCTSGKEINDQFYISLYGEEALAGYIKLNDAGEFEVYTKNTSSDPTGDGTLAYQKSSYAAQWMVSR